MVDRLNSSFVGTRADAGMAVLPTMANQTTSSISQSDAKSVERSQAIAASSDAPTAIKYSASENDLKSSQEQARLAREIEKLNRLMGLFEKEMRFQVDSHGHDVRVQIIDVSTGKVINEIPQKNLLDTANAVQAALGLVIDAIV